MENYKIKFSFIQKTIIESVLNDISLFSQFKTDMNTIFDLQYCEQPMWKMFDYFSKYGVEYILSSGGMSTRTYLIKDVCYKYSNKLLDCFNTNDYKAFKIHWNKIKKFVIQ